MIGQRVTIYNRPHTNELPECEATVLKVIQAQWSGDCWMHYCQVETEDGDIIERWIRTEY